MKTFSKVLSMILVGVMCFGLFATSAFASEFVFNDDGGSVAQSADFGGGDFSFESAGSGFSFESANAAANDGFTLEAQQPAAPAQSGDFALNSGEEKADTKLNEEEEVVVDGFKFEDNQTFDKPYTPTDSYTFTVTPNYFDKNSPADVVIKSTGTTTEADTFNALAYTKSSYFENSVTISESNLTKSAGQITIKKEWLKTLPEGTYYIWGLPTLYSPVYIGFVHINGKDASLSISPSTYVKQINKSTYDDSLLVWVNGDVEEMAGGFGIVPVGNTSGGKTISALNYDRFGSSIRFTRDFLNSLSTGEYYIVGFPVTGSTSKQVTAKPTLIIKDGGSDPGSGYTLSPDYPYAWSSGDAPLDFWSDLMKLHVDSKNHTIVLRYSYGANTIPNIDIGVHQYWEYENGYFALGTNFLNSLPAGVYTLQVMDLKPSGSPMFGNCTNTVTFRIGAKLVPIDSDKHVINSIRNLRFLCDEPISQVYVGNIPLTYGEDYALSANRKTVTLSYEFLNKRSAGNTYTIKVLTDSGQYCSTTFQILTTAQGGASPRTGDESNLGLWAAFLLLSGTAVVVLLPKLRKHGM